MRLGGFSFAVDYFSLLLPILRPKLNATCTRSCKYMDGVGCQDHVAAAAGRGRVGQKRFWRVLSAKEKFNARRDVRVWRAKPARLWWIADFRDSTHVV